MSTLSMPSEYKDKVIVRWEFSVKLRRDGKLKGILPNTSMPVQKEP